MVVIPEKILNIRDYYFNQLRKEKIHVIIYLTNGVRLKGAIKGFNINNLC